MPGSDMWIISAIYQGEVITAGFGKLDRINRITYFRSHLGGEPRIGDCLRFSKIPGRFANLTLHIGDMW
jgi:hypothetical protein